MSNQKVCLVRINENEDIKSYLILRSPFVIGRSQTADVTISHPSLSRDHVEISFQEEVFVVDKGSTNGSSIEGRKLAPNANNHITKKQKLSIGSCPSTIQMELIELPKEFIDLKKDHELEKQLLQQKLKDETDQLLNAAKSQANGIELSAKRKADDLIAESEKKSEKIILQAESKKANIELIIQDRISKSKSEVDDIVSQYKKEEFKKVAAIEDEANQKALKILSDAQSEALKIISETERKRADILNSSTQSAEKILNQARSEASEMKSNAKKIAESMISDTTAKTQEITSQLQKLENEKKYELENLKAQIEVENLSLEKIKNQHTEILDLIKKRDQLELSIKQSEIKLQEQTDHLANEQEKLTLLEVTYSNRMTQTEKEFLVFQQEIENKISDSKKSNHVKLLEINQKYQQEIQSLEKKYEKIIENKTSDIQKIIEHSRKVICKNISSSLHEKLISSLQNQTNFNLQTISSPQFFETILQVTDQVLAQNETSRQQKANHQQQNMLLPISAAVLVFFVIGFFLLKTDLHKPIDNLSEKMVSQRKIQSIYNPTMTKVFQSRYTDNILILEKYYQFRQSPQFQKEWTLKLVNTEFSRRLGLREENLVQFIAKENQLIEQLQQLRETIDAVYLEASLKRLRDLEAIETTGFIKILKNQNNLQAIRKIESELYQRYYPNLK